ncbi:MAG: transglycosylase SLT domain-containing protein [Deltaproteobacteria bacterium]|nr:transglycosylase SLT domain-containing protein [Deltaproteobacteria bacterium]
MKKIYMKIASVIILFLLLTTNTTTSAFAASTREIYADGRKFMREGKWQKAIEIVKPLENDYQLLADYVLLDLATCYEKSGDSERALNALRKIVKIYKTSPLYRKSYQKILDLGKSGDITALFADYDLYLKEFPQDSKVAWDKAGLLEKSGRSDEARALRKEIFFSGSDYSMNAYEALKKADFQPSAADIKKVLVSLLENNNYAQVVSLTEGINFKDDEGKYLLARAYFRLRRYSEAIKTLAGVSSKEGKYLLAQSLVRAKENEAFYKLIAELAGEGRQDLFSLHILAAEMKRRAGDHTSAGAMLQSMLGLYPEKKEEITWSQAWLNIRQKRYPDAEKILASLAASDSNKRDKFLFWLAKVKKYQGQNGDAIFAQIKDKNSYYWFQSGISRPRPPSGRDGADLKKDGASQLPEEMNRKFLRITTLHGLEMSTEARTEARLMMSSVTEPYISAFAQLLLTIEDYLSLVRLGGRHNYPLLKYPLAFGDIVAKCAQAQEIDPFLIMAIMREESHFQRDVVSSAGALGIMQLLPATARSMANIKHNEELFDPEKNIRLGTNYFAKLLVQFKLSQYAIAAYNAGPHNVEKWLAMGYQDEEEFTEDIPFGETKSYVFRIMQTRGIMKALYKKEPISD